MVAGRSGQPGRRAREHVVWVRGTEHANVATHLLDLEAVIVQGRTEKQILVLIMCNVLVSAIVLVSLVLKQ